jgi:acetyl-CoA acetyltransferase
LNEFAIISGVHATPVGALPGSSCLSLHDEAASGAISDAGLKPGDIDGVICAYSLTEPHLMLASWFSEFYGLAPNVCFAIQAGGASGAVMVSTAASLVESGACRHVLVVAGDNRLTGLSRDGTITALAQVGHAQFERPYGMSVPAAYALVASRYMHEYGAEESQLAAIAVTMRDHASRNCDAHQRELISIEDVLNSPVISSPLRRLDCSLVSDGGGAVVISSGEARSDLPNKAVKILGSGQGHTHEHIVAAPSLIDFGCKQSAEQAFGKAGIKAKDIDIAEIYDSFTITLLVELESIGFFERGEAGPAIANGALQLDGSLPCNTHGGLLSHGHPGAAGGIFHVVEAVTQLRHAATGRQVENPELAFVHGDGGILSAHCSLVLARD